MSPLTHLICSWLVAAATTNNPRDRKLVTWAGVLPDADGLGLIPDAVSAWISGGENTYHYYHAYHHLLFHGWPGALFISGLLAIAAHQKWRTLLLCLLTFHLHLLCDLIGSRGPIIADLWPICYSEPPVITSPPQSQSVQTTSNVTFTVTAVGTPPLFYQWQLNGARLPGATDSSYTRAAVQLADAGSYSVTVTNIAGSVTSPPAWLTVLPAQAAQFEACARLADGRVHLRWRGEPGWSYTVQAATNLYFSPALQFGPFTSADGWFEFVDDEATNAPQRFYRIQQ